LDEPVQACDAANGDKVEDKLESVTSAGQCLIRGLRSDTGMMSVFCWR